MATTWQFVGIGDDTADIQAQDGTGAILSGFRYNGDYNEPAVLQAYLPTSNMFMLTSLANKDYDVIGDGSYTLNAASIVQCSDNQTHNEYSISGFILNSKFHTWIAAPGDGTSSLYPSADDGVGYEWISGDAGSVSDADGGGYRWKVGNNNGNANSYQGKYEYYDGNSNLIWTLFQKSETSGHALGGALAEVNFLYHDGSGTFGGSMIGANVDGNKQVTLGGLNNGDLEDWTIGVNQTPVLRQGSVIDESTTTIDVMTDGAWYAIVGQPTIDDITFNGGTAPDGSLIRIYNDTGSDITFTAGSAIKCPFGTNYALAATRYLELFKVGGSWILKP